MKFLELIGFGNNFKHFIPLRSLSDITFEPAYTRITLTSGVSVNVIENEEVITRMIENIGGNIVDSSTPPEYYIDGDMLHF